MRVLASEEVMEELPKGKRKRPLSAIDTFSDDSSSEDGQLTSHASSVTLSAQSPSTESPPSDVKRLADIETMLTSHEEILRKLLSASEAASPPAPLSEGLYEPPPARAPDKIQEFCRPRNPEDIYERARIEAGFSDFHEWTAAYIHGMVGIGGEPSKSITKYQACGRCKEAHNFAVCIGLMHEDPYREFLVDERNVCCGWCEYEKYGIAQSMEDQRPKESHQTMNCFSDSDEDEEFRDQRPKAPCPDAQGSSKLSARPSEYFISGEGIDREVIANDISLYLGLGSVVRPGVHKDLTNNQITNGYYIKAHRPLTPAMLADLRSDSAAWNAERENRRLDSTTGDLERAYLGKQPSRFHTYSFEFTSPSN